VRRPHRLVLASLNALNLTATWLPAILFCSLLLEAVWLRWTLSRWPTVYVDEAHGLVGAFLDLAASWALIGVGLGLPVWLVTLIPVGLGRGWSMVARRSAIVGMALLSLAVLGAVDPFRFVTWWLD
jgi:hypothetical protein